MLGLCCQVQLPPPACVAHGEVLVPPLEQHHQDEVPRSTVAPTASPCSSVPPAAVILAAALPCSLHMSFRNLELEFMTDCTKRGYFCVSI